MRYVTLRYDMKNLSEFSHPLWPFNAAQMISAVVQVRNEKKNQPTLPLYSKINERTENMIILLCVSFARLLAHSLARSLTLALK